MTNQQPGFNITNGRGFCVTLSNGVSVSVQFGRMNYCNNYDLSDERMMLRQNSVVQYLSQNTCENAEVALWNSEDAWITKECWKQVFDRDLYDDVVGCVKPDDVVLVLQWAQCQPA